MSHNDPRKFSFERTPDGQYRGYIYALMDAVTGRVVYIGQTGRLEQRKAHYERGRSSRPDVKFIPIATITRSTAIDTRIDLDAAERDAIRNHWNSGPLENVHATPPSRKIRGTSELEIGTLIRKTRLIRGWTQTDLARQAGLSYCTISQIERGCRRLLDVEIRLISAAIKAEIRFLPTETEAISDKSGKTSAS